MATLPFPAPAAAGEPWTELELILELPESAAEPGFRWASERLTQERLKQERLAAGSPGPAPYRLVSRRSAPLPEHSSVQLPLDLPELLPFLRNEHDLGLDLEELRKLGEKIRGEEKDPARIVRAIVDWAHHGLEYSVIRQETSVEEILTSRQADCTEFSRLTIALARSLGIPARPVSGIYVGSDAAILHRWAEVYLDRWYEIDSTFGRTEAPAASLRLPGGADGDFLARTPGSRFVFASATGRDGSFARKLKLPEPAAAGGATAIQAEGQRVTIGYQAAGTERRRVALVSTDGGLTFSRDPAPPPEPAGTRGRRGRRPKPGTPPGSAGPSRPTAPPPT